MSCLSRARKRALPLLAAALLTSCGGGVPSVTLYPADAPPQRLSDWGLIHSDGAALQLSDAAVPYSINTPLFTDYALKLRTVWMPEGASAVYRGDGPMDFPVGTILTKTFHYERGAGHRVVKAEGESMVDANGRLGLDDLVLIETRLLIRYETGWRALPYVWNADQTEARLEIAGDIREIEFDDGSDPFVYVVPDANQCAGCHVTDHTAKAMEPIGPSAWQLNRPYGGAGNQLADWEARGILSGVDTVLPAGVVWDDEEGASLDDRARAYLDANCAHCHNARGAADTSALDLALESPVDRNYGICKPPVAVGRGSGDRPYDIYPGRPDDSIMLYRMQHTDPAIAMPELGRSTVHAEGVELLSAWVRSLDGDC